ncbi:MAG: hypothetical protein HY909_08690 [Deltaproteobacteria bacterium]|nr:hypothetical protein [Deltaproteobacteria bacterium]
MDSPADCRCLHPPFHHSDYTETWVGVDPTHGRYGEVTLETCRHCGRVWLRYLVEYEAFKGSGRWYRALLPPAERADLHPTGAVALLERLEPRFAGGSYFASAGFVHHGPLRVDH